MTDSLRPVLTLSRLALDHQREGGIFEYADAPVGVPLRLTRLGANYTEVPPGKSACPFHSHHAEDEMFVILSGQGEYRYGDACYEIAGGDVLGAPVGGPETAHQIFNTGSEPLKYLAISSKAQIDICEYPDSGKFSVTSRGRAGDPDFRYRFVGRPEQALDYWDGEETAK